MTIRPIVITGDPVLHHPAAEVSEITEEVRQLVADMYETMAAAPGVGLAAPQVGIGLRVFVYDWHDGETHWRGEAINPTLAVGRVSRSEPDEEDDSEGCLSVPGERFPLKRAQRATLSATDLSGHAYEIEAHGWLARIFQHEFDHLNGMLYVDRLREPWAEEAKQALEELGWGKPSESWLPGRDDLDA